MILGTGIDIIEVDRIERASEKPAFLERMFTEDERIYLMQLNHSKETIAGMFAAKEAVSKALGTGMNGIRWTDMQISRDEMGKPYVTLTGAALERMNALGGKCMHISISHIRSVAVANAILEG